MTHSESFRQSTSLTVEQAFSRAADHHQAGKLQEAERLYRAILNAQPDHAGSRHNLDILAMDVAAHAFSAGRYAEAEMLAEKLTAQSSTHAFGLKLLGTVYGRIGRYSEALELLHKAALLMPSDAEVHNSLGAALHDSHQLDAAIESGLRAVGLNPEYAEAHNNLGYALNSLGRFRDAIPSCRRALEIRPNYHMATFNLGIALLGEGRYREGWPCYERRDVLESVIVPDLPFPPWRGESLRGKSLLLWPEQGFGDYIQFIRYASLLKALGVSRLTVRCSAPLRDLLATAPGVDEVITDADADPVPTHDYWSFPLSLPLHFGATLESIPATLPYLRALPERLEHWGSRLPVGGLKVGIVWKGSSAHSNDAHRSLPALDALRPLWSVPGVTFVSLQKGAGEEEAATSGLPIVHLGSDIRDFADTAAIVEQLDLVICVDTAIAHVAGALGKPCWVLLPAIGCDWRWMRDRSDSPWYPGALRLFRQTERGDWSSVIEEVAIALRKCAG